MRTTLLLLSALALAACSDEFSDQVGGEDLPQDTFDTPPGTGQEVADYAGAGSGSDLGIDEGGIGGDGISDRRAGEIVDLLACGGETCGPVAGPADRAVE